MGNKPGRTRVNEDGSPKQKVCKDDFEVICSIGEGNYANVLLVKKKGGDEYFAMKILSKDSLIARDEVEHTRTERKILECATHPFLVKMHYAFQTSESLYIVMGFANGGELFSHLKKEKRFSEDRARFYAAEIALGLEYLHDGGVVYRDLKPENILLDSEGHIILTDFGLSKILKGDKTKTFCGTPEYLAPEVLLNTGHGKPVDWWSFGTLLYEMVVGIPPFYSTDVSEMYDLIVHGELYVPEFVSPTTADLLTKLLVRDPNKRIGTGPDGTKQIKNHAFFKTVDWKALYNRQVQPPFKPAVKGPDDISNVDPQFTEKQAEIGNTPQDSEFKPDAGLFDGFTYERSGVILDNTPGAARTQERQRVLAEANSVTAQSCDL
jgi:serine/threonine protein kinase